MDHIHTFVPLLLCFQIVWKLAFCKSSQLTFPESKYDFILDQLFLSKTLLRQNSDTCLINLVGWRKVHK